jgi:hypothetical protein
MGNLNLFIITELAVRKYNLPLNPPLEVTPCSILSKTMMNLTTSSLSQLPTRRDSKLKRSLPSNRMEEL